MQMRLLQLSVALLSMISARENTDVKRRKSWTVSYPPNLKTNEHWREPAKVSSELYLPKYINGAWKSFSAAQDQEDIWFARYLI